MDYHKLIIEIQQLMASFQTRYENCGQSLDAKTRKELFLQIIELDLLISKITELMMRDLCIDIIEQ